MGFFEELQEATDIQYILTTDYIAQLAKEQDSSIESTINYLLRSSLSDVYEKQAHGQYTLPYHGLDEGSHLFNILTALKEFFKKQVSILKIHSIEGELELFNTISKGNLYFKKSELPVIRPTINKVSKAPPPPNHINIAPTSQKTIDKVIGAEKTQSTESMAHDVCGRTYDVKQHKKNREDDYLTLSETLDFLNYRRDTGTLSYDHVKLRDLARRKLITPCFYFDGYIGSFRSDSDNGFYTEVIAGYFTYRSLAEEICRYDDHMKLPNAGVMIYSILEKKTAEFVDYDDVFLFYDKPQGLKEAEKLKLKHIEAEEIRFSKRQLDSYIASLANNNTSQDATPVQNSSELLAKLEKLQVENEDLNSRLSTARNTYKQHRNEIKELKEKNEKADSEKAELIEQLNRVKAELISKPADAVIHSNTDIQNIKKVAIRQFNRSLAIALTDLDYQNNLRKGDIVNFIIPHMKELAYVLADEQADKAKVLMVKYKTIYDNHLQGLEFKQGTQTKKERERVNIDLLFKKQLPVTE